MCTTNMDEGLAGNIKCMCALQTYKAGKVPTDDPHRAQPSPSQVRCQLLACRLAFMFADGATSHVWTARPVAGGSSKTYHMLSLHCALPQHHPACVCLQH
jgi:hypothetical protein